MGLIFDNFSKVGGLPPPGPPPRELMLDYFQREHQQSWTKYLEQRLFELEQHGLKVFSLIDNAQFTTTNFKMQFFCNIVEPSVLRFCCDEHRLCSSNI